MKEYKVQIMETLIMTVTVEAKNAAHARDIVEKKWNDSEYILDANHFQGVDFTTIKERSHER